MQAYGKKKGRWQLTVAQSWSALVLESESRICTNFARPCSDCRKQTTRSRPLLQLNTARLKSWKRTNLEFVNNSKQKSLRHQEEEP